VLVFISLIHRKQEYYLVTLIGLKHKDRNLGSGCVKEKDVTVRKTVVQERTCFLRVLIQASESLFELDYLPIRQALGRTDFFFPQ